MAGRSRGSRRRTAMQVRDGMSPTVLTVGPGHTLRDAARLMSERRWARRSSSIPRATGRGSSPSATSSPRSAPSRTRTRARRRPPDPRRRVRRAGLVLGGGRGGDGARRLSPSDRGRTGRDRGDPLGSRRRALLDRRRSDLSGARRSAGRPARRGRSGAPPWGAVASRFRACALRLGTPHSAADPVHLASFDGRSAGTTGPRPQ